MKTDYLPDISQDRTTLSGPRTPVALVLLVVGVAGLGLAVAVAALTEGGWQHFYHSYLVNFCYFLSISLGALFFVATQHVCRAGWSVTVRRVAEVLSANLIVLAVLFLPILVTVISRQSSLYPWLDPELAASNHVLEVKTSYYLNLPFFLIRCIVYFAVWAVLAYIFLSRSRRQDDTGEPELTGGLEKFSAPALILFGVTVSFASFDLLMSLDPLWFSTIYGLYYFSGAVVGGLSATILLCLGLQTSGRLSSSITVDHYHELGKLLLGFIVFWGYMAFSQYMLIWYANIPEETAWFQPRQTPAWVPVSLALLFGHLLIPFFGLLPREVKRRKPPLAFWAVWLLVFHWVDLYWIVMPSFTAERFPLGPMDVCLALGLVCLYLAGVVRTAGDKALVPLRDPRLGEALAFENF